MTRFSLAGQGGDIQTKNNIRNDPPPCESANLAWRAKVADLLSRSMGPSLDGKDLSTKAIGLGFLMCGHFSHIKMSTELHVRIDADNPNHHLWNNHGTWWIHFTIELDGVRTKRVRRTLGTTDLLRARSLRDEILQSFSKGKWEGAF